MLSCKRFFIFVRSHHLRDIINVVPWRIRVGVESMQLSMLRYFGDKITQSIFLRFIIFIAFVLIFLMFLFFLFLFL